MNITTCMSVAAFILMAACNNSEESTATKTDSPKDQTAQKSAEPNQEVEAPPDVAAPPADAKKTDSGLAYKVLSEADGGPKPQAQDTVQVHYTGWTTDGKMFDSSLKRGQPARFKVKGVIPGWTEGLQIMSKGDKYRFWIPANLAYGEKPARPGAPAGMLVFDVELLEIVEGPKPIAAPEDVSATPADATKTDSGLAYRFLEKSGSEEKPNSWDEVEVHYTGWTTQGEMFDSSVQRGRPAKFPLNGVIKGWTEGLQLMAKGDKARFWIPADLAYGEKPKRPGAPAGMLVFDVELLNIKQLPKPPDAPLHLKTPSPKAKKLNDHVSFEVLQKGKGKQPTESDRIELHYTVWDEAGKMLTSTAGKSVPALPMNRAPPPWRPVLTDMKAGEKRRVWVSPGADPRQKGMQIVQFELLKVIEGSEQPHNAPHAPHGGH